MSFQSFQSIASSRFRFGAFMLLKLPSAFICGVRVRNINEQEAVVSIPFKWLSQNPFKSIYFACQAMAAEMSTGLLALGHIYGRKPAISMLVTEFKASYFKKATQRVYFTCADGHAIKDAIEKAITTGEGQVFEATSTGRTKGGELVTEMKVTWSFKVKSSRT